MSSDELISFLKRVSPIPNKFIDDMFSLYHPETAQTDFAVDVSAVATWLGVRKDVLMRTLRASYTVDIDYSVTRMPNPSSQNKYGRNAYKHVLLTPDCFKRVCMRSRGRTAEDVRTYFIQVEALVVKYRSQMAEGMQQELSRLASTQHARTLPVTERREGYIYVLRASQKYDTVVKIGRTRDLMRRLREHAAALADDPEVLFLFRTDDAAAVETCVKGWLSDRRWKGAGSRYREVYKADPEMVKQLIHGCDLAGKVKRVSGAAKIKSIGGGSKELMIAIV
jgi:phage anti-repressor protein